MYVEIDRLNNERSEEEKAKFFGTVLGDRVRTWYVKERI